MKSIRYATRVKPAPVRSTIVLFDASLPRRSPKFGQGILRSLPTYSCPFSQQDADWASQSFGSDYPEDETFDALADEYEALCRLERGFIPHDRRRGCLDHGSCQGGDGLDTMIMGHMAQE